MKFTCGPNDFASEPNSETGGIPIEFSEVQTVCMSGSALNALNRGSECLIATRMKSVCPSTWAFRLNSSVYSQPIVRHRLCYWTPLLGCPGVIWGVARVLGIEVAVVS